jgi:hypothetical protein
LPGGDEGGTGLGAAEAEDEAVHFAEELADFTELGPEGKGEGAAGVAAEVPDGRGEGMDGGSGQDDRATGGREVNREGAEGAKFWKRDWNEEGRKMGWEDEEWLGRMDEGSGQDARATGGREVNREGAEGAKFL